MKYALLLALLPLMLLAAPRHAHAQGDTCVEYTLVPGQFVQLTFQTRGFLYYTGPSSSYVEVFSTSTDQSAYDVLFLHTWVDYSWIGSGSRYFRIADASSTGNLRACQSQIEPTATATATNTPTSTTTTIATNTPTSTAPTGPSPTATAIPTVVLSPADVLPGVQTLAADQVALWWSWRTAFLLLASVSLVAAVAALVRRIAEWRTR